MPVGLRLRRPPLCPPDVGVEPDIDYLAKDYQGFRRLMLDRLSLLVPGWTERSAADLGVMLVELLAYAADNLSYRQDAIANEAYLATARQRVSVRRHARLVDYVLHEGCNARALVHVEVVGQAVALAEGTPAADPRRRRCRPSIAPGSQELRDALAAGALVFETAHDAALDERLNRLSFYTWGDPGCCLPRGATRATLRGHLAGLLHVGDVLVFEEVVSPTTFVAEDADRAQRWAVRLTAVTRFERSVGPAVRRAAGRRPRSTSPRSTGTPPTRCRSRCACRSRSGPASRSASRWATSCSPTTAGPSPTRRSAPCRRPTLQRVPAAAGELLRQARARSGAAALPPGARRSAR